MLSARHSVCGNSDAIKGKLCYNTINFNVLVFVCVQNCERAQSLACLDAS